jgi:hypothetical protein
MEENKTNTEALASAGFDVETVLNSLQNEAGSVTSSDDTIDASFSRAIAGQKEAALANQQSVESQFGRESVYLLDNLTQQRSSILEAGRGGATGSYGLQIVDREIEKSLRDLEQRKSELVLQGNAAAANEISKLEVQQLQFRQQAQQQTFSNLLQLGGIGLQYRSQTLAEQAQGFQERSAMAGIALEYGLTIQPGETIDSLITRASGLATEDRKLQLDKTRAEIANLRAQASFTQAQAQRAIEDNRTDDTTITAMALAADRNQQLLLAITNPHQRALVENKLSEIRQNSVVQNAADLMATGMSYEDAYTQIINDPFTNDIAAASAALKKAYEIKKDIERASLAGHTSKVLELNKGVLNSIGNYVFGNKWTGSKWEFK